MKVVLTSGGGLGFGDAVVGEECEGVGVAVVGGVFDFVGDLEIGGVEVREEAVALYGVGVDEGDVHAGDEGKREAIDLFASDDEGFGVVLLCEVDCIFDACGNFDAWGGVGGVAGDDDVAAIG